VWSLQLLPSAVICLVFVFAVQWLPAIYAIALAFVVAQLVSFSASFMFLNRVITWKSRSEEPSETGLLRYSLPLLTATVVGTMIHYSDIIMLGILTDSTSVGMYHPAARTAGMISIFGASFSSILGPTVSGLQAQDKLPRIRQIVKVVARWNIAIALISCIFLVLYGKKVLLLFGGEFLPAYNILAVLACAQVLLAISVANGFSMTMMGLSKVAMVNNIVALIINVGANAALIPRFGLMGAALGSLIAIVTLMLLRLLEGWHFFNLNPFEGKLMKVVVASATAGILSMLIKPLVFPWHTVLTLLIGFITFMGIFLGTLLLLKLDETDWEVVRAFGRKFGLKK
jgi:O-antigen/teichoic acid export membrane protein